MAALPPQLDRAVARAFFGKFASFRPAQERAVPALLSGQDAVILAGTGSGKTEAAVVPLVSRYLGELLDAESPVIVYVAPTRALVNDIFRRLEPPFDELGIRVGVRHGELNHLDRATKPTVLVTTPESMDVMLSKRQELLSEVRAVIVDEAHLLYNKQRGLQLAILVERLQRLTERPIQVVAMSATVADHRALWSFFRPGVTPLSVRDTAARTIERDLRIGWTPLKLAGALDELAGGSGKFKALVFADSRKKCDMLAATLRDHSAFGDRAFSHHSSLSKDERLRTEKQFAELRSAVCVATSTLELGIDIGDIDLVVLWGHPTGWESFLQRIGRGNRRSSNTVVLCVVPDDEAGTAAFALGFQSVLRQVDGTLETPEASTIYGAACQQIVSMAVAGSGKYVPLRDFRDLLAGWSHLRADVVDLLVEELVEQEVLVKHPVTNSYGPGPGAHQLEDDLAVWSNFPISAREIPVYEGNHHLGNVQGQNLARLEVDSVVNFAGGRYAVRTLRRDHITVVRTSRPVTLDLKYSGSSAVLDPTLVETMHGVVRQGNVEEDLRTRGRAIEILASVRDLRGLPEDSLAFWREGAQRCYLTFAGAHLNIALSSWLGGDASATELVVRSTADLYPARLPEKVADFGPHLPVPDPGALTRFQMLLPQTLLRREHSDPWSRVAVYQRALDRLRRSDLMEISRPPTLAW